MFWAGKREGRVEMLATKNGNLSPVLGIHTLGKEKELP